MRWRSAPVYLDDSLVFLNSSVGHIEKVRAKLRLRYEADVQLHIRKCRLFAEMTGYSGNDIQPTSLKLTEHTTVTVKRLEKYKT